MMGTVVVQSSSATALYRVNGAQKTRICLPEGTFVARTRGVDTGRCWGHLGSLGRVLFVEVAQVRALVMCNDEI